MIAGMPGKVFTLLYQMAGGRTWARRLCDAQFMESWMAHLNFRMVK
jgi:hypothetical protein